MDEVILVLYIAVAIYTFDRLTKYFENNSNDGDPEGTDAFISLSLACFWPVWVPVFFIYKKIYG